MNEYLKSLILGLVQGLTEFLPVSSSGHLALLAKLGLAEEGSWLFFMLMLHVGTLLAVLTAYRKRVWELLKHPTSPYFLKIIVATIPTVMIAAIFKFLLPDSLLNGDYVAFGFIGTTVLLILSEVFRKKNVIKPITYQNSIVTGIVQGIAVLPGLSRSGSTISTMLFYNVDKNEAADFSFLLSIPIIIGSAIVESLDMSLSNVRIDWGPVVLGVAVAFVSGFFAIKFLLRFIKKYSFVPFAIYTGILGILALIFF
jgi:Uncharacterized bacitracin resistance protein